MTSKNSWWEEKRSAYLYSVLANHETNILHKKLFTDLHDAAEKQAHMWEKRLLEEGFSLPVFKLDMRTRFITLLIPIFGPERLHSLLSAMKIRGMSVFSRFHTEKGQTGIQSASNLRAAVFGVSDGLVSNMSLILGIAGANADHRFILIAGVAGLLAGACSMGAGEYISVRTQREVFEYQIAIEREELEEYPEEEAQELALIYQARGIPQAEAISLANFMISHPETGLSTLAREELGLNPSELVSPIGAMLSSFFSFVVGAGIPLVPFCFGNHAYSLAISIILTGGALFLIGMLLSLYTHRSAFFLGLRMLLIGAGAGLATYLIGKLLGVVGHI